MNDARALRIEAVVCDSANARAKRWKRRYENATKRISELEKQLEEANV